MLIRVFLKPKSIPNISKVIVIIVTIVTMVNVERI
jgi:hypothetical protein